MTIWLPEIDDRQGPRYKAIADALADDVADGGLTAGDRLPTHRDLAYRLGVTVGTISRAYAEAESRGLVYGQVGRGTFVREPRQAGAAEATFAYAASDESGLIDLSLNLPAAGDRGERLAATLADLAAGPDLSSLVGFGPEGGSHRHRAAGAEWMAKLGVEPAPSRVLVCNGAQHAMAIVFAALCRPGDTVLVEELTYPGIKGVADLLNLRLRGLPLDAEGLRPDALEDACRNGDGNVLYCVPSYQNPTTAYMSDERRDAIAEIARRHGLTVVEDDVYGFQHPAPAAPLVSRLPNQCCYVTSASKVLGPGMRVGYAMLPEHLVEAARAAIRATCWMTAPLNAEIVSRWIEDGGADDLIAWHREEAGRRAEMAYQALAGLPFRHQTGAYHMWLDLPPPWRVDELVDAAAGRGVRLIPPDPFLVGRGHRPHGVRLSLGSPSRGDLARGLDIVAGILAEAPRAAPAIV